MPAPLTDDDTALRKERILSAARWCFLNFGFAKTTIEEIATRANISRPLVYRTFKDKEEIYRAVFASWLLSSHRSAKDAAKAAGSPYERVLRVCQSMVQRPWTEMVGAPLGREFLAACERIDPASGLLHRKVMLESIATILRDKPSGEVFVLALDGLLADRPSVELLDRRIKLLAARFAPDSAGAAGGGVGNGSAGAGSRTAERRSRATSKRSARD